MTTFRISFIAIFKLKKDAFFFVLKKKSTEHNISSELVEVKLFPFSSFCMVNTQRFPCLSKCPDHNAHIPHGYCVNGYIHLRLKFS